MQNFFGFLLEVNRTSPRDHFLRRDGSRAQLIVSITLRHSPVSLRTRKDGLQ